MVQEVVVVGKFVVWGVGRSEWFDGPARFRFGVFWISGTWDRALIGLTVIQIVILIPGLECQTRNLTKWRHSGCVENGPYFS